MPKAAKGKPHKISPEVYLGRSAYRGYVCATCGKALLVGKGFSYRHTDYKPPA